MLTHANFLGDADVRDQLLRFDHGQALFQFLPLAHVLARVAQAVTLTWAGGSPTGAGIPRIVEELRVTSPTHLPAVPRIYEKIHTAVRRPRRPGPARGGCCSAGRSPRARARARGARRRPAFACSPPRGIGSPIASCSPRSEVCSGRGCCWPSVGAAPVAPALIEFFDACGVLVLEGYGMTETCSTATLNPADAARSGTVGRRCRKVRFGSPPIKRFCCAAHISSAVTTAIRRHRGVLTGRMAAVGDLGLLTDEGYLKITGRKKDLIITSSGKNITPVEHRERAA